MEKIDRSHRIQASVMGLGRYDGDRWICSEPKDSCTRASFQFERGIEYDQNGDPIPAGKTAKFDLFVMLDAPSPHVGDPTVEIAVRALESAWRRGAAGCVMHFLNPTRGGGGPGRLGQEDVSENAKALFEAMNGPLCGTVLLCPTGRSPEDHAKAWPTIEKRLIRLLHEVQGMYVVQAHNDYDAWQAASKENRSEAFEARLAPPIGVIGYADGRLLSLHDVMCPTIFSAVDMVRWLENADPDGFGAELDRAKASSG